jgi:cell division protein FtsB
MAPSRDIGLLWQLACRIENVFDGVQNATRGLEKLRDDLRELEKRVAKLEGGEEPLIERARSSAAVAASGAVTQHLVEMSRRIGALEERSGSRNRLK